MASPRVVAAVCAVALLLGGCASTGVDAGTTPSESSAATATPTATPTPEPESVPSALVVGLDDLGVVDTAGTEVSSAAFADPDGVISLLTDVVGAAPTIDDTFLQAKGFRVLSWPGIRCTKSSSISCRFTAATVGDLSVGATGGITVGSARSEVEALDPFDPGFDGNGDGVSDFLGLDPRPHPGTESLLFPDQVGTDYVLVQLDGDVVTGLQTPAGDWTDL